MRAITVRPPWSWAIAWGGKVVENRSRPVSYRGPLAIHSGLNWSARGASDDRVVEAAVRAAEGYAVGAVPVLAGESQVVPRGAIVAVCELTDCHPAANCCAPWGDDDYYGSPVHHLALANVVALETPIPATGRLGLWTPPEDVLALLPTGGTS